MKKCPKHPKYLAIRKPKADCSHCHEMYAAELKAKEAAEEKDRNKSKNANNYLEVVDIFKKLDNVGPYWKDVLIKKPKWSKWEIECSVRLDNGYGGNMHTVSAQGNDFLDVAKRFIEKIEESDRLYSGRYM